MIPKTKSVACSVVRQNVSVKRIDEGEAVETKGWNWLFKSVTQLAAGKGCSIEITYLYW